MSELPVTHDILAQIAEGCGVTAAKIQDVYACVPLQAATMVESTLHPGASVFRFILSLSSSIDHKKLCVALEKVVSLNTILRTRLINCPHGLVQVVIDERHVTRRDVDDANQYLELDKKEPMGLGASLFRGAIAGGKLILTIHHGIMDHGSLTPLFADLMVSYYGYEPEKRTDFKEFTSQCLGIDSSEAKAFWEPKFSGTSEIFPAVRQGHVSLSQRKLIHKITLEQIGKTVSLSHLPSFIEAAWALTVSSYTGSEKIAFGMLLSGRNASACPAAKNTMGPTMALFPVQIHLQRNMTVEGILKDRTTARQQLQRHHALYYGLNNIRGVSEAAKNAADFQTFLNIRPKLSDPDASSALAYEASDEPHGSFALSLSFDFLDDGVSVEAAYDPIVLSDSQLRRTLHQLEHFMKSLMEASSNTRLQQLPKLNSHDLSEILKWAEHSESPPEKRCLHDLVADRVQQHPSSTAVDSWDGCLTYHELDQISNHFAHHLRNEGISKESPVALIFQRSIWTVVSILAVLKAGGVCVPISISDPPARKAALLSTTGARIILASSTFKDPSAELPAKVILVDASFISGLPEAPYPPEDISCPDNLAYILHTSGSTGAPKAVLLTHQGLASTLRAAVKFLDYQPNCRVLQFASYVWDASIGEIFSSLLSGGCICIPSEEDRNSNLAGYLKTAKIDNAWLTPTVIRTLSIEDLCCLKGLLTGGEAISSSASKTLGKSLRLINAWGPCEASVLCTAAELSPCSPFPETIGRPLTGDVWIVSASNINQLVPIGAVGEILIDGPGVAQGYLKDSLRTKLAFIKPPVWAPARTGGKRYLYRTGDLGKFNSDGSITFIGRQDSQIKIRGQRLELAEIENVLATCPQVRDVFISTKTWEGRTELVAVVSLIDPDFPSSHVLQEVSEVYKQTTAQHILKCRYYAQSKLPSYMIPTAWLVVERMPRAISAKMDRAEIIQWLKTKNLTSAKSILHSNVSQRLSPPCSAAEKTMQAVWEAVLGLPATSIGQESIFFELGGDSIMAMQAATQCRKRGLEVSMVSLLKPMTLSEVAASSANITSNGVTSLSEAHSTPARQETNGSPTILNFTKTQFPHNKYLQEENIEALVPATDSQAGMLTVGEMSDSGYYICFTLSSQESLNVGQLYKACEQVIQHHAVLRTVFVCHGPAIYQLVLKSVSANIVVEKPDEFRRLAAFRQRTPLAWFHLVSEDNINCHCLHIEIHHALYDAISLGLVFHDLDAAYTGKPLSNGPQFYEWASIVNDLNTSESLNYWKKALEGASMSYLIQPLSKVAGTNALGEINRIQVLLQDFTTSSGTPAASIKACWSILLSHALNSKDVVFGEVSANRFLTLPVAGHVKGPCLNLVPVRSHLDPSMTLSALISQIQELSTAAIPFHHISTRSIINDCTPWPSWTRFSSSVVYQNHNAVNDTVKINDISCVLSHEGNAGDSADAYVVAVPSSGELVVELRLSSQVLSSEQIQWIIETFHKILQLFPHHLHTKLEDIQTTLRSATGSYKIPRAEAALLSEASDRDISTTSKEALDLVSQAWQDAGLQSDDQADDGVYWDCGGDLITSLLLSDYYCLRGHDMSVEDVVRNPTRKSQALLIDLKPHISKSSAAANGSANAGDKE